VYSPLLLLLVGILLTAPNKYKIEEIVINRTFAKKNTMKIIFLLLAFCAIAFGIYWFKFRTTEPTVPEAPKQAPLANKKHSESFNKSVDSVINAYLAMKNALVNDDSLGTKTATTNFVNLLTAFPIAELQKDTAAIYETAKMNIEDMKSNAVSLNNQTNITEMRRDFNMVTTMMYPSFFKAINYEGVKLYYTNCPMAFGDSEEANWISDSREVVNPYLGKVHPKYKATMLNCGEVKDSIEAK
jgi:Protein of unknown function (DUF3347)